MSSRLNRFRLNSGECGDFSKQGEGEGSRPALSRAEGRQTAAGVLLRFTAPLAPPIRSPPRILIRVTGHIQSQTFVSFSIWRNVFLGWTKKSCFVIVLQLVVTLTSCFAAAQVTPNKADRLQVGLKRQREEVNSCF